MGPLVIVEVKVSSQTGSEFGNGGIVFEVDVLVFETTPQAFDEDIVQSSATSVHADADSGSFETSRELIGGELRTLIRVENGRLSLTECLLECIQTEIAIQRVGELPSQDIATKPVDDGDQIHEALVHGYIGDVSTPDKVGLENLKTPQQIGVNPPFLSRSARLGLGIDGL